MGESTDGKPPSVRQSDSKAGRPGYTERRRRRRAVLNGYSHHDLHTFSSRNEFGFCIRVGVVGRGLNCPGFDRGSGLLDPQSLPRDKSEVGGVIRVELVWFQRVERMRIEGRLRFIRS